MNANPKPNQTYVALLLCQLSAVRELKLIFYTLISLLNCWLGWCNAFVQRAIGLSRLNRLAVLVRGQCSECSVHIIHIDNN